MTATKKRGGGSFRELRERYLPLFNHHRGREETKPEQDEKPAKSERNGEPRQGSWKTIGIFHFRAHDED